MLNDNENINDMSEQKDINEIKVSKDLLMNNSILLDDKKTLNLVKQVLDSRGETSTDIPETFEDIPQSTFAKMRGIDKIQERALISRDVAIELIADLFESDGMKKRFEEYANDLFSQKLKKLYELIEIKYEDLLHALNTGSINEQEFMDKYSKLRDLESNSIEEITSGYEILHSRSK